MSELELKVIENNTRHYFSILDNADGKAFGLATQDWEPADGSKPWRVALHPWINGLAPNRINPSVTLSGNLANSPGMTYAKANADASNQGYLTFPPAFGLLSHSIFTSYFNTAKQLYYDGAAYGTVTYMGAVAQVLDFANAVRTFNGKAYFSGGQFLFSIDSTITFTLVKDFGTGKIIYDIEPFNDELVIAMGETEKIWTMDTDEVFTQATDDTFAIALGKTQEYLWRAENVNEVSNCIASPLTLASWVPADPYIVGDTTYSVTDIKEYGGAPAVIKPDGVYLPDANSVFYNQTPQLQDYPDADNGKGTFNAYGFLFVPSITGLLRVTTNSSVPVGPELAHRPDFRLRARAGVEWNGDVYVVCTDEARAEFTFVCKMVRNGQGFDYHEWLRLESTEHGRVIIVYTEPTSPTMIAGIGNQLAYWKMGRGRSPDVDDPLYEFNTVIELEPGMIIPSSDLGILIDLVGVKLIGKQVTDGTLKVQYSIDDTNNWQDTTSNIDGAGDVNILVPGFFAETRYAQPNARGHVLYLRLQGTMPEGQLGKDRTELYEWWAFGNAYPDSTDIITVDIDGDSKSRVRGLFQGRPKTTSALLRSFMKDSRVLELKIPGYASDETIRAIIVDIQESNKAMIIENRGSRAANSIRVSFRRVDFSGDL